MAAIKKILTGQQTMASLNVDLLKSQPTVGTTDFGTEDILFPAVKSAYYLYLTRAPHQSLVNADHLRECFRLLNKSITIPGITLGTVESVNGFAGTSKSYAFSTVEDSKELTIGFNENVNMIVMNTFKSWVNGIKDTHTGLSRLVDYTLRNLSCDLMLITTKPVHVVDPEDAARAIDNVFWFKHLAPTSLPTDQSGSRSKEDSSKIELEITFKYREMIDNNATFEAGVAILPDLMQKIKPEDQVQMF